MSFFKKVNKKAKNIKLIASDIDGVLTKGEIIFINSNQEIKIWNVHDGLAFTIIKKLTDIKLAWISGRSSKCVSDRAKELGIDYLIDGCLNKKQALDSIIKDENISKEEITYIGDDIVDIPVLKEVGLAVCPKNAPPEVRKVVHYVAPVNGGCGVFRNVVELILKSLNKWTSTTKLW